jgi:hypothetical protein
MSAARVAVLAMLLVSCVEPLEIAEMSVEVERCYDAVLDITLSGGRYDAEVDLTCTVDGETWAQQTETGPFDDSVVMTLDDVPTGLHTLVVEAREVDLPDDDPAVAQREFETSGTLPFATIATPGASASVTEYDTVTFGGQASDVEDEATALAVQWSSDLDGVLDDTPPDVSGAFSFDTDALSPGLHTITLRVIDSCDDDALAFATVDVAPCGDDDNDGYDVCIDDCDDDDDTAWPGAPEGVDADLDGILDGDLVDNDCDGTVDEGTDRYDDDGDGWTERIGDCDDGDAGVNPLASDPDGNGDEDCDGLVDEGLDAVDDDGDGYAEVDGDCDDTDDTAYPGASDPDDGVDHDCDGIDGSVDVDDDGDGVTEDGGDCDDGTAAVHPLADEVAYDGIDQDCDGDDLVDVDEDGEVSTLAGGPDCGDLDPDVNTGADEVCNGVDDDCDGTVDFFEDLDSDGYSWCDTPELEDCDDANPVVYPTAVERFDCLDNDCDGEVDDGASGVGDVYEPNESPGEPTNLGEINGFTYTLTAGIHIPGDGDWYAFYSDDGWWDDWEITAHLSGMAFGTNYNLELYDGPSHVREGSYNEGTADEHVHVDGTPVVDDSGTYWIRVWSADGTYACDQYTLSIYGS